MSASASQIEREVEASRANVEDTVEALKDKMSLGQMFDEATRYFGETGGGEIVGKLTQQIRENPLPIALVGIGLVWLMSGRGHPHIPSRRGSRSPYDYDSLGEDEYRRTFGESAVYAGSSHPDYSGRSTGDYENWSEGDGSSGMLQGAGDAARSGARGVRHAASSAAGGIGSAASGLASGIASAASGVASGVGAVASGLSSAASGLGSAASHLGRSAYSAAGSVAGGARSGADVAWRGGATAYRGATQFGSGASRFGRGAQRSFSSVLESEPLVLGALGLAIGAAIGAMLPRTEYEDRYLGETRDRLREDAEAYAREQFERGKAVAEEAYRTAKQEAEAQGLTTLGADSVAGRIGEVARATYERVKESAAEQGLAGTSGGGSETGERTEEQPRNFGSTA